MPRYEDTDKDKVRDAVDLVDLISTRTELRRSGPGEYKGLCPFHDERTPSFHVTPDKGMYYCFGCGAGGDAFRFVQETEGLDFVGALESLAQRYGIELTVADEDPAAAERRRARERLMELLDRAASFYERFLWESAEAEPARAYLRDRGFTEETLRTFRVGYAPSAWDKLFMASRRQGYGARELFDAGLGLRSKGEGRLYDRFRRRITFPLCDQRGRVLGFGARALGKDQQPKYLNSPDGDIFHKGDIVYGSHLARSAATKADEVIATEGYMDVLALHQAGIENAVCIMGTSLTERQVGELAKLGKTVLLALDADSAGQEAMMKASRVAAKSKLNLRVVPMPDGLDPADVVQQEGADAAREMVGRSVPFVRFQVERELDRADLSHAEGKDAAIAALRPVFATLPPSALRQELLAHVAGQVGLDEALVSSWLPVAGERAAAPAPPRGGGPGGGGQNGGRRNGGGGGFGGGGGGGFRDDERFGSSSAVLTPRVSPLAQAEGDFLAQCIATPDVAAEVLAGLDLDSFSSDAMRRVLVHVRDHLRAPQDGLPEDDAMLSRSVAKLVTKAADLAPSRAALQGQLANIEVLRLTGQIAEALASGTGGVAALRQRRDQLATRRDALIAQAIDEQASAS
ncbi:MAG TPA: DNA primase [Baekduia sp.]|uniref:DNA primase n=1 Tax=Baekduia sp. TaxID=2600305 RepID=UPI002D79B912|nr:DNA primase [Baekduia sp.]HET6507465.1 DNA primase [Baekduia sp.]